MKRSHSMAACLAALLMLSGDAPVGDMPGEVEAMQQTAGTDPASAVAERYVRLVLALGEYDPDYVDAYYGPPEWRGEGAAAKRSIADIDGEARTLLTRLASMPPPPPADELHVCHQD
jgi:hypothetical protein